MKNYWLELKERRELERKARKETEARWKRIDLTVKGAIKEVADGYTKTFILQGWPPAKLISPIILITEKDL